MLSPDKLTQTLEQLDNAQQRTFQTTTPSCDRSQAVRMRPESSTNTNTNASRSVHERKDVTVKESSDLANHFRATQAGNAWERKSRLNLTTSKNQPKCENTYRMAPDPADRFKSERVKEMIKETVDSFWTTFEYEPAIAGKLTKLLTNEIESRVVHMKFKRYKLVCNVILMQNRSQGVEVASRCMWTTETDSFASYTFRNGKLVCIANVHGVYFE